MVPYFLLIILPLLIGLVGQKYRITSGGKILYETQSAGIDVFMLLFALLLACRGLQCGTDTRQYLNLYREYSACSFSALFRTYDHELGYKLLNWLIGNTAGDFQWLLIVSAAICVYPLWYFYRRESEHQMLTIVLFLTVAPFVMYFSGIRQAIAVSMGVPAWYAAKNKKLPAFLAVVLLAMQFHTSAFVLLLVYPLYHANITKKWLWFVVPCMAAVFVFRTAIFRFLMTFLWKDYGIAGQTGATAILMLLVLFALYAYILPADDALDKDTAAMRNILLLSVVIQIFAMLHPLSMRMNYYFLILVPVLLPKIANRSKKMFSSVAPLSVVIMTAFFACYFLNSVIHDDDALNIFPYIPFWNQ